MFHLDLLEERGVLLGEPTRASYQGKPQELRFYCGGPQVQVLYWIAPGQRIVMLTVFQDQDARFARDLGYPPDVLLAFQAAYAVATSNAFTPDGDDGHFAWCIAQLRRDDISEALNL
jgi:hypothetical protein